MEMVKDQNLFFQCGICKVVFVTRELCLKHKRLKHPSENENDSDSDESTLSTSSNPTLHRIFSLFLNRPTNNFAKIKPTKDVKNDEPLNLDETIPDVVKMESARRSNTVKEEVHCHYCKKELNGFYTDNTRTVVLEEESTTIRSCKNCVQNGRLSVKSGRTKNSK